MTPGDQQSSGEVVSSPETSGRDPFVAYIAVSARHGRIGFQNAQRLLELNDIAIDASNRSAFDIDTLGHLTDSTMTDERALVAPLLRNIDDFSDGQEVWYKPGIKNAENIFTRIHIVDSNLAMNFEGGEYIYPPTYPGILSQEDHDAVMSRQRSRSNIGSFMNESFCFELSRLFDDSVSDRLVRRIERYFSLGSQDTSKLRK